ncbi:MAG: type I restriction enzyme HsdR N-terminal domain-containing protein [Candidatus Aminicenantes bacterium]|nr:type I restriction enzyme HsdR N-terminal domain-containing protein [Candidatus Aminicenantes bacterium]
MEKELKKKLKNYSNIFREAQEKGKREADVVMYLVEFFKDVLGYNVFTEISKEYQIKEKYCDIAIKLKGQAELLVEAKQPSMRLADRHIEQAEMYAVKSGTKWVLLTNGCDWKLFHISFDEVEGIERALAFKTDLLKSFEEKPNDVVDKLKLLHKRNLQKGELERYWKKKIRLIPSSFSKALFSEDVLKAIRKEVNRGAEVKVGIEDIFKALTNMLDKEILADMAKIKRIKKKKKKKTTVKKVKPTGSQKS